MKIYNPILILITFIAFSATSCKPDPIVAERDLINEWIWEGTMQPITFEFTNAMAGGISPEGIQPDYEVDDFLLEAKPFGDITDLQLAKALELITGISPLVKKATQIKVQYEVMSDPVRDRKNRALLELNGYQLLDVSSGSLY